MIECKQNGIHYHRLTTKQGSVKIFVDDIEMKPEDIEQMRKQGTPEGLDCIFQFTPEALAQLFYFCRWLYD